MPGNLSTPAPSDTPTGATTSAPAPTPTPTPTPSPTASPASTELPGSCTELIPTTAVVDAVARPLPGGVRFVSVGPVESSGRTGRTTCGYGAPEGGGEPAVQVSLNGYVDAQTAQERIQLTVTRSQADGSSVVPQPVGDRSGYVLQGADGASFVVADGTRTLVVTLRRGVVPQPATRSALGEIAAAVLDRATEQG